MSKDKCCKKTSIGGQALIEGIMMRGPHKTVMAVRRKNGEIAIENMNVIQLKDKYKFLGWPIIRGAVSMVESMIFGYKALMKSADMSGMLDEEEEEKQAKADKKAAKKAKNADLPENTDEDLAAAQTDETAQPDETGKIDGISEEKAENEPADKAEDKKEDSGILMTVIGAISMVLGVALAIGLFIFLPSFLFKSVNTLTGDKITAFQAVFEGVLKIVIFVIYIALVAQMKDIKRVFMYHGAEHKTIFCYEHGKELTVENVRTERRFHPRCGTSFLILMLIVSIVFYMIVARLVPVLAKNLFLWIIIRIICLPVIIGIGYELIKFCGRHDNLLTRIISAPGMWLQHITTNEPDDSMIEVAIKAMTEVIPENSEDDEW